MKRFLLFVSSFVIVLGFASLLYFILSPNHATLRMVFKDGNAQDRQIAAANALEFEKAHIKAIFGDSKAQYKLGRFFKTGEVSTKDAAQSLRWMEKSAAQDNPEAMMSLARFSFTGFGMDKDEKQGAAWVQKAADKGSSAAQGLLGILYIGGIGVAQDFTTAQTWLLKSKEAEAAALASQMATLQSALEKLPPEEQARVTESNKAAAREDIRGAFEKMISKEGK